MSEGKYVIYFQHYLLLSSIGNIDTCAVWLYLWFNLDKNHTLEKKFQGVVGAQPVGTWAEMERVLGSNPRVD